MNRQLLTGIAGAIVWAILASPAMADRTLSRKTTGAREFGARPDTFVPYTTNGRGTLGVWQGVGPLIYSAPGLGDPAQLGDRDAQQKPVYNLIYYGSKLSSGDSFNGAMPRLPNQLRPYVHRR